MATSWRKNIIFRYTFTALVTVIIISLVFGYVLTRWSSSQLIKTHTALFPKIVRELARDNPEIIRFFNNTQPGAPSEQTLTFFNNVQSFGAVFRIKVWGRGGVILYSNDKQIIGRRFPDNPNFIEAWSGQVSHNSSHLKKPEQESEGGQGPLLEIYTPLIISDQVIGVIEVYESANLLFQQIRRRTVVVWLLVAASGLTFYLSFFFIFRQAQKWQEEDYFKLTTTQDVIIYALAYQSGLRDLETGKHLDRISHYVKVLVTQLQKNSPYSKYLHEEYLLDIIKAAPLHDIGKVGIPDAILTKPGKLTAEERREMQKHSHYGSMVLKNAETKLPFQSFLTLGVQITKHHHERWDGQGYPDGLKGDAIPLSARIIGLADVYDALRSERYYKPAFDHKKAMDIITSERGKHFDPHLVDAFSKCEKEFERIAEELSD